MLYTLELNAPQADIISATTETNLLHCGQGLGKTLSMGVLSALFVSNVPEVPGLIASNTYNQLSDSTLVRIFDVWKKHWGWTEYTKENTDGVYVYDCKPPECFKPHGFVFKTNNNKIFLRNGAVLMLASLDNYKAIDGREVGYALLDETKDTREIAVKEVIVGRLRHPGLFLRTDFNRNTDLFPVVGANHPMAGKPFNPLYIFTSPAKEEWLSDMFNLEQYQDEIEGSIFSETDYFLKEDLSENKTVVIASAYHNSKNLPPNYISNNISRYGNDRAAMLVYGSPFGKTGNEYYTNFKELRHVKVCKFTPQYPLKISYDFNVNPYMTLEVQQIVKGDDGRWKWRFLDEFCFESPKNSIEAVTKAFLFNYEHLCEWGLDFYGDATGKNSLPLEEIKNFYNKIEQLLRHLIDKRSRKLLRKNPNHRSVGEKTMGRRDLMNLLFSGLHPMQVDIEIDPKCKRLIADLKFLKEDPNGAKHKQKEKVNGISVEKYGHASDAMDATGAYEFGDYPHEN